MSNEAIQRGQGAESQLSILTDPHRVESDLNMLRAAVKADWPVPESIRPALVRRLIAIAEKVGVNVRVDDDGNMVTLDAPADANAIKAIALLNTMTQQHAGERMEVAKMLRVANDSQPNTQVNVQAIIYNGVDQGALLGTNRERHSR